MSAAYRSLHINTSRDQMSFADFPMPKNYPPFPHHSKVLDYFESYVDHFGIRGEITFRTSVERVEPQDDGSYLVTTVDHRGRTTRNPYSAVMIANGHHWRARTPKFDGAFEGRTIHAHDYRTPEDMKNRRVLVVGIGNSGCDIACEVSRVAEKTFMCVRRGAHIIPKYMFGKPMDQVVGGWAWRYLPHRVFQLMFEIGLRLSRGRVTQYGLPKPQHRILEEHPTISAELLNLIGHGKIHIRPGIERLDGTCVRFENGVSEDVDTIVFATGYDISMPFLSTDVFSASDNEVRLYKNVVHPCYPGLYFVGLVQPWGAIMPLAEEQSKWIADLIEGRCGLPSRAKMESDISRNRERMAARYTRSRRHTIQVDFYPYLDDLRRQRRRAGERVALTAVGPEMTEDRAALAS